MLRIVLPNGIVLDLRTLQKLKYVAANSNSMVTTQSNPVPTPHTKPDYGTASSGLQAM